MRTPYKQAYVVTLQTGLVLLAVVSAVDTDSGQYAARNAAAAFANETENSMVWDICTFPTSAGLDMGVFPFVPKATATLDETRDVFESDPKDISKAAAYVRAAASYARDEMIEPGTFSAILEEVSKAIA